MIEQAFFMATALRDALNVERQRGPAQPSTIYASLVRLQQRGWIVAEWAFPTTTARPRSIRSAGRRQMTEDTSQRERLAAVMGRVPAATSGGGKA